ncbi:xaa-Pro dipeptidase [Liquorilactobacillus capillatus DSM 19910]|uniref:Xaa-Pro dipeptidase n=2 Tax=Liquorilactobacillus capillatus TaxID=480931 RepID=A0A0R1MAS4_9LACO|nr:xaa-Pro dipeptidase [Liquorilactobacillus capillatus DSM 19910]
MDQMSLDAFLVTKPVNIRYLSGFTGDAGILLITEQAGYLLTDSRFEQQAQDELTGWETIITHDCLKKACQLAEQLRLVALGFEDSLSYRQYDYLDENAMCDIVPLADVVEELRSIKEPIEIEKIRKAGKLAGKCYQVLLRKVQPGYTELDLANWVDGYMRQHGASASSFPTIIAGGEKTAQPHAAATARKITSNELLLLDFGYYYQGYTTDVSRTFAIGPQSSKVKEIYAVVLEAQRRTMMAIQPGIAVQELDHIGRSYIESCGYGAFFNHGMGHGIGLEIHELPNIGNGFTAKLQVGQVVTVEPGIYLPGTGGVRLEDDILVTKDGHEILTDFERDYHELKG